MGRMAQRFDIAKVTSTVAAAMARGERTSSIVRDLQAGSLDGLPGVEMSQRNAWRYVERARKRLTAPDEQPEASSFLAELEKRVARERRDTERVEVRVEVPRAQAEPEPVTAPESTPEPTPEERLVERVASVLGADEPGYADAVREYLARAKDAGGMAWRLRSLQAQWRRDPERNSVLAAALREVEPQPEPVQPRKPTRAERAWARELARRDREAFSAPDVTEQQLVTGYRAGGF
jgi:hypothetical protein